MKYKIELKPKAIKDLKSITKKDVKIIIEKLKSLEKEFKGDIKRLTNYTPEYRMRVRDYRILFEIEDKTIIIYHIRHRKEAYR